MDADKVKIPSTRSVLIVAYPIAALACGVLAWLAISLGMPGEPHPVLYGIGTAVATLAYMYIRTWFDFRKARASKKGTTHQ